MAEPALQLPESFDANKAVSLSMGMASPLWLAFAGAAMAGSAFWWMSRWARPTNLEAASPLPTTLAEPQVAVEKAVAAIEPVIEPVAEVVATAVETAAAIATTQTAALAESLAQVDPVVDAAPAAAKIEAVIDDLTTLVGIGPKLAASLADRGVTSFAQIAAWTADDLAQIDSALSLKGRAVRDAWVAQARRFAEA